MPYNYRGTIAPLGEGIVGGINSGLRLMDYKRQRERQNEQDDFAREDRRLSLQDRSRNIQRQDRQDARLDQQWEDQREDRTRNIGRQEKQDAQSTERHQANMRNSELSHHINNLNFRNLKDKTNMERLQAALAMSEEYHSFFDTDDMDGDRFRESMNIVFSELFGEGKNVRGYYPMEDGSGLMFDLDVEDEKGKRKAAMTVNRSSDPEDGAVIIPWSDLYIAMGELDAKLAESGFDMSSPETRTAAFDILHAAVGNPGRGQKRLELNDRFLNEQKAERKDQAREIREWTQMYLETWNNGRNMKSDEKKAEIAAWEAANPGQTFIPLEWARQKAEETLAQQQGAIAEGAPANPATTTTADPAAPANPPLQLRGQQAQQPSAPLNLAPRGQQLTRPMTRDPQAQALLEPQAPQEQQAVADAQPLPAPRNVAEREVGVVYVAPDGRLVEWAGNGWRVHSGAARTQAQQVVTPEVIGAQVNAQEFETQNPGKAVHIKSTGQLFRPVNGQWVEVTQ